VFGIGLLPIIGGTPMPRRTEESTMNMRPSRVLRKLRAGETASCVKLNLADARVAEIAAQSGIDCIWVDLEHVPNSIAAIEQQVRAAKVYDVDTVVRVKRGSYSDLIHPLEMDATGIMVPHVMSLADAKQIAQQTRFHPIGRRPLDGGNADGAYCQIPLQEYLQQANQERFVIIQIEDPEPLEELDQIARVPGIDMLFFGPGDFSHAIGEPGNFKHPRLIDARKRVAAAARVHGKFAGTVASAEYLPALTQEGYRFLNIGADVIGLTGYFGQIAQAFSSAGSGGS
jgi:4-hydroxy-2-oxoheptanedioate aldolase